MLSTFPIKFDNEAIITPISWEEESEVSETINQTEAGTDQIVITRYDKLTINCTFQCSSTWAKKFKNYSTKDEITVSIYNILSETYSNRTMRIRNFKVALVKNSWKTSNTNGLWNISFSLKEF